MELTGGGVLGEVAAGSPRRVVATSPGTRTLARACRDRSPERPGTHPPAAVNPGSPGKVRERHEVDATSGQVLPLDAPAARPATNQEHKSAMVMVIATCDR